MIKQNHIEAKSLKLVCEENTIFYSPTTWDYFIGQDIREWRMNRLIDDLQLDP